MADLNALTGLIYDAALDTALWPRVLEDVCDAVGSDSAALLLQDQISKSGSGLTARLDPDALGRYYGEFRVTNPLIQRNDLATIRRASRFGSVTDRAVIARNDLMRTDYYNTFLEPGGIHSVLMIGLSLHGDSVATFNLMRSPARDEFDSEEIVLGETLRPHLARAFALSLKLGALRQTNDALLAQMDHLPYGIFLIGNGGKLCHANRAGAAMLQDGTALRAEDGRIVARSGAGHRLTQLIGNALLYGAGGSLMLPREGRGALSAIVSPVRRERALFASEPMALLCVTDPDADLALPTARLHDMFGLTPAEARIALELLAGHDLKQAAQRRDISFNTVRVHLARIMDKTGTHRQAELVRLLMRVMGMPAD